MKGKRAAPMMTVREMALASIDLPNRAAWRHIETLLIQGGVTRQRRVEMKVEVWDERARLRHARKAAATLLKSEETPLQTLTTTPNRKTPP